MRDSNTRQHWFEAIESGNIERISEFMAREDFNIDAFNVARTALEVASANRFIDMVILLLDRGADIEETCIEGAYEGYSPLIAAAGNGHKDVVRLLLDEGANIEALDNDANNALIRAAKRGHKDVVKILIKWGAHPLTKTDLQTLQEAFDEALDGGNIKAIKNIYKYSNYKNLLKLDDRNSINTENLIEFTYTYGITNRNIQSKLGIITDHEIVDDTELSLAIKVLKGKPFINKSIKAVFGSGDLLKEIIEFVGFDRSLPFYQDLRKNINNIKWTAQDILSFPDLRDLEIIQIINNEEKIIDVFGQFY